MRGYLYLFVCRLRTVITMLVLRIFEPCHLCYCPETKLREGNVFSSVRVSTGEGWSMVQRGISVQRGFCPWEVSVRRGSLSRISLSRGSLFRGISVRGVSVQGVSVQGVSVQRDLSPGSLCPGGLCSGRLCPWGSLSWRRPPPPLRWKSGRYASYWNSCC